MPKSASPLLIHCCLESKESEYQTVMKQSFTWWSFSKNQTPDELLKAAADIGYSAVEILDEKDFPLSKKYDLAMALHRGHLGLTKGMNRREHHAGIMKELEANIKIAEEWNIPNLVCFSGNRDGISDDEGAEITTEILRKAAPLAEASGVMLVLELLNSKVDHPDYQCDHTPWGVKVIEMVASPKVKLLYDIYHMQIMEGDLIRTIKNNHQHIGHYHTAGNPGRNEINETQEIYYPPIFRAIRDTLYTGYIAHEFVPTGDVKAALKQAFDLCVQSLK
jgi:hydroxypyruvate isomerase